MEGAHPGEKVHLVSRDFGMGQDVFEEASERLRDEVPQLKDVTPADLQAILWFAEKEVWGRTNGRRSRARRGL